MTFKKIKKSFIYIIKEKQIAKYSFIFFLINFIYLFGNAETKAKGLLISFIPLLFITLTFVFKNFMFLKENKYFLIWLFFSSAIGLTEIINLNYPSFVILLLLPIILHYFSNKLIDILLIMLLGLSPIIALVITGAILGHNFGSNTIGITTVGFYVILSAYFMLKRFKYDLFIYLILTSILFRIILLINSRTSQVVFLVVFLFYLSNYIIDTIKTNNIDIFKNKLLTIIIFLFIIIVLILSVFVVYKSITTTKWRPNDISTGRFDIWKTTYKNKNFFGHKYDWYYTSGLFQSYGPHNFFVALLGYNGIFGLISGVLAFCFLLYAAIRDIIVENCNQNKVALLFLISPLTKGLTEGLLINSYIEIFSIIFAVFLYSKIEIPTGNLVTEYNYRKRADCYLIISLLITVFISVLGGSLINFTSKYI